MNARLKTASALIPINVSFFFIRVTVFHTLIIIHENNVLHVSWQHRQTINYKEYGGPR